MEEQKTEGQIKERGKVIGIAFGVVLSALAIFTYFYTNNLKKESAELALSYQGKLTSEQFKCVVEETPQVSLALGNANKDVWGNLLEILEDGNCSNAFYDHKATVERIKSK